MLLVAKAVTTMAELHTHHGSANTISQTEHHTCTWPLLTSGMKEPISAKRNGKIVYCAALWKKNAMSSEHGASYMYVYTTLCRLVCSGCHFGSCACKGPGNVDTRLNVGHMLVCGTHVGLYNDMFSIVWRMPSATCSKETVSLASKTS